MNVAVYAVIVVGLYLIPITTSSQSVGGTHAINDNYDDNMNLPTSSPTGSVYCPSGHDFIHVGMPESEVIGACGQPNSKEQSNQQATRKVPVKQLIYTSLASLNPYPGLQNAVFNQWSIPSGIDSFFTLHVSIINHKVSSISLNGTQNNAMSICGGNSIQVGDDESQVYAQCGSPNATNNTYINQQIPGNTKPETWIYQVDPYQPSITLTFVNGSLESIN